MNNKANRPAGSPLKARAEQAEKSTRDWQSRAEVAESSINATYHLISEIDRAGGDAPPIALGILAWIKGRQEIWKASEARADRLQTVLDETIEDLVYVDLCYQEKHDLAGCIQRLRDALK